MFSVARADSHSHQSHDRDTVSSVGLIPRYLPFTSENTGIRFLRHAIALDEHRIKFLPQFCVDVPRKAEKKSADKKTAHADDSKSGDKLSEKAPRKVADRENNGEAYANEEQASNVQEVWFSGVHCGKSALSCNYQN